MTQEVKKFDAEIGKVLHLMIHSLYSNKEIFLRELISNSSDACDKLKYLSQTQENLLKDDPELKINIILNKEAKTITIHDNGIGMDKADLIENLGTIAKSGTQKFIEQLSGDNKKDNQLIGQFGVGFYSAFMVAKEVTVTSCKAGQDKVYQWSSNGQGEYTIEELTTDFNRGTEITLHIKESEEELLDDFKIKHIIKSYSDHIAIPITFQSGKEASNEPINSASALWTRAKSEITPEQYQEFYKNISHAIDEPWLTLHNKNEGAVEFTNLLFVPSSKTFDLFHPDRRCRVKLYIKRVFITDENVDIIPQYLRFLRGVIDSQDLPLNISRQTLQANATVEKIKRSVTKRVLSEFKKQKEQNFEQYLTFWQNFGGVLKEGLCEYNADQEKLMEVCIFHSALHNKMISLDDYINNIKGEDKTIYYLSGDNVEQLKNNPQIEGFLAKGIDVLLFTDTVDDFWVNVSGQYKEHQIKSVTRSDIDLKDQDQPQSTNDTNEQELIEHFKKTLGDLVKDVKISKKLSSSPACLAVAEGAMDIRMERYLIEQKQLASASAKILEINPQHHIIKQIANNLNGQNQDLIHLIYDQACIIEGEPVKDAGGFAKRLNSLFEQINTHN